MCECVWVWIYFSRIYEIRRSYSFSGSRASSQLRNLTSKWWGEREIDLIDTHVHLRVFMCMCVCVRWDLIITSVSFLGILAFTIKTNLLILYIWLCRDFNTCSWYSRDMTRFSIGYWQKDSYIILCLNVKFTYIASKENKRCRKLELRDFPYPPKLFHGAQF